MKRPPVVQIIISWIDEKEKARTETFNEKTLEDAETLIGLMTGNVTEEDLKP